VLVGWRRLAGAVDRSPEGATLCLAGVLVVGLAAAARIAGRLAARAKDQGSRIKDQVRPARLPANILVSAAVLLLATGVSMPGAPPVPLGVFWALIAAEELWFWAWRGGTKGRGIRDWGLGMRVAAEAAGSGHLATSAEVVPDPQCQVPNPKSEISNLESPIPNPQSLVPLPDVLQQLTLSRDAAGRQELSGWLRLCLEAGQRSGNLHVAFCPPFAEPPQVHCEQSAGPACSIKTAQVLPYGARLELKLAAAAWQPESVVVRFSAKTI
jgi:hypothetical protein